MARTESRTKTAIWSDDDFRKLTGRAQRMYWMLFSQSTISLCGVLALTERRWAASSADETADTVRSSLTELEECQYILLDWGTEEVLVRSFVRHDGIARSPKTSEPAWRQLANIASPALRAEAERQLAAVSDPPAGWTEPPTLHTANRVSDHLENRVYGNGSEPVDSQPDTPRGRARAVSRLQSPTPDNCLPDSDPPPRAAAETSASHQKPETRDQLDLAKQVAGICLGRNRSVVNTEAAALVLWALPHLDRKIIEEAISWCAEQPKPPDLPRTLGPVIVKKARDRGIGLTAFVPPLARTT